MLLHVIHMFPYLRQQVLPISYSTVHHALLMFASIMSLCVSLTGAVPEPVLKELVTVKVNDWYNLGLQLDIDDDDLQTIKRDNPRDENGCKRDMFRTWLRICPQASYRQLVQALVALGDVSEADRLCKKHGEPCKMRIVSPTAAWLYQKCPCMLVVSSLSLICRD